MNHLRATAERPERMPTMKDMSKTIEAGDTWAACQSMAFF